MRTTTRTHGLPGSEVIGLVRAYVIQETVAPFRQLAWRLICNLAGATLWGIGLSIGLLGVLRTLQAELGSDFTGNLSFLPYLIVAAAGFILAGLAVLIGVRTARRRHAAG